MYFGKRYSANNNVFRLRLLAAAAAAVCVVCVYLMKQYYPRCIVKKSGSN